jgi:hypothetical protein
MAVLPLMIALAGCEHFGIGAKAARPVMPPADTMLREIPLEQPSVEKPEAPGLKAPRVASLQKPPARSVLPPKKPAAAKEDVPTVEPGELVGADFTSVLQVLRKPDTVQNNALSVVWTYSQAECTVQLFFYPDIQTKIFRLLKYDLKNDAGEKLADRSACLHEIMVKNDDSAIQ